MSEKHEKNYKSVWQGCIYLARAIGVPIGRRFGGRLATTLVAPINVIIFHFLLLFSIFSPPPRPFLIEGVLVSTTLFSKR